MSFYKSIAEKIKELGNSGINAGTGEIESKATDPIQEIPIEIPNDESIDLISDGVIDAEDQIADESIPQVEPEPIEDGIHTDGIPPPTRIEVWRAAAQRAAEIKAAREFIARHRPILIIGTIIILAIASRIFEGSIQVIRSAISMSSSMEVL